MSELKKVLIPVGLAIAILLLCSCATSTPQLITISTPLPTATPPPTPTPTPLRIHVTGAVSQSAVYTLPPGSLVRDAIEAAGGPTADADLDRINLAIELRDHQKIYVPRQGETNPAVAVTPTGHRPQPPISGGNESNKSGGLVNINTATATELETLPRVGPATAARIIAYRQTSGPFQSIQEIQNVPGIGPATFAGLEDLITVE